MDARAVIALLRARVVLASRDRWTRDELLIHQSRAVAELRDSCPRALALLPRVPFVLNLNPQ